ncbi:MAG: PadR family transcriptional regulator [Nocardioides sp.]
MRGGAGDPDFDGPDFEGSEFGGPDFGRPDFGRPDFGRPSFGPKGDPWSWATDQVRRHEWNGRGPGGPPPWLAGVLGLIQGEAPRPQRVRRGDVRTAILSVLALEPMNGYQIIAQIAERSGGAWKPSPGSIYPTISQLEDEGLIEGDADQGRRTLRLTAAGERYVAEHPAEVDGVWASFDADSAAQDRPDYAALKPEVAQLMSAVWQIVTNGTDKQRVEAIKLLTETRRRLYLLLADDPSGQAAPRAEGEQ